MVLPSGEKATDMTQPLCALGFSALSSSVAAEEGERARRQLGARRGSGMAVGRTRIPHFDRAAVAGGHDLGAIGREGDGFDWAAVGVLLLGFELESACGVRGKGVISERSAEEKS